MSSATAASGSVLKDNIDFSDFLDFPQSHGSSQSNMTELLDNIWRDFASKFQIPEEASEKWLALIKSTYEKRICYDLPFLELKLKHFQGCQPSLKLPYGVFLALIFQSIYYDTKSTENAGECIKVLKEFAKESGIDKDTNLMDKLGELIELSVTNSMEEQETADAFGQEDHHYFLDINLVIWASSWEDYSEFSGKTRREYEFLNDTAYKSLRLKVLQSLLLIPNLFATKEFRSQYEDKARDNIRKEINSLK